MNIMQPTHGKEDNGTQGVERGVRGDANPHPETKFEGKRCISCGKFFFTDIASDKCINCIPDRIT